MRLFKTLPVIALCVGAMILAACSNAGTNAAKMTDSDLERAITARFAGDAGLKDVSVDADADKNEVTLAGKVTTQEDRSRAFEMVKAVNPALQVTDKIDVKPQEISRAEYTEDMARQAREQGKAIGDKVGDTLDDAWIHAKITSKLLGDTLTPARKINVDVMNNVVTLRGSVDNLTAKTEAERIAKETEGVKRVVNLLIVKAV